MHLGNVTFNICLLTVLLSVEGPVVLTAKHALKEDNIAGIRRSIDYCEYLFPLSATHLTRKRYVCQSILNHFRIIILRESLLRNDFGCFAYWCKWGAARRTPARWLTHLS